MIDKDKRALYHSINAICFSKKKKKFSLFQWKYTIVIIKKTE